VTQLDRDDLIHGLRDLVALAHERGVRGVSIRIVGGAALRLAHFERATTADIDAQIRPLEAVQPLIEIVARNRGWPVDWLNANATMFLPFWGRGVEWSHLFEDDNVSIDVAPIDALLAMKLNAARPGRDTDDIAKLLALNAIHTIDEAQSLFESFYPGESLSDRAMRLLTRMYELGLPPKPDVPPAFRLD
jgi:hypothetical protein